MFLNPYLCAKVPYLPLQHTKRKQMPTTRVHPPQIAIDLGIDTQGGNVPHIPVPVTPGNAAHSSTHPKEARSTGTAIKRPIKVPGQTNATRDHGTRGETIQSGSNKNNPPDEWTQVVRRPVKKPAVVGSLAPSENLTIKARDRKAHLHLSNLHPETECDSVADHLQSFKFEGCIVEKIRPKHPEYYSSFKLTIPFDLLEKINSPAIWPLGAKVRRFRFFQTPRPKEPAL